MAFSARQITLVTGTATPLLVLGSGSGSTFKTVAGTIQDPLPVLITNLDAVITIYIGGSDVSGTAGVPLAAGQSLTLSLYGSSEIPYAYATGTPKIAVLVGRQ
jgi:hypothetical protein